MPYKVVVTIGSEEVPSPGSKALGLMLVAAFESAIAAAGVVPWKFVARQNVRAEKVQWKDGVSQYSYNIMVKESL